MDTGYRRERIVKRRAGARLFIGMLLLCGASVPAMAADQEVSGLLAPFFVSADATRSWVDRGLGKLREGAANGQQAHHAGLRLALDYRAQLTDTLGASVALDGYADGHSAGGITEAWLRYAPVPTSAYQFRYRAGLFLPPLSFENTAAGWTTPYTLTPSLLNDWIGEELRAAGVEAAVKRLGVQSDSPSNFALRVGLFEYNDTAGTILSWRGWAANNRVTPWNHVLPLPDRPAFRPGGPFRGANHTDPFIDVGGEPGYYVIGSWQYLDRLHLQVARYDNRADSTAFSHGQIGWRTRFSQIGLRWHPARGTDVIAQYLAGDTLAGRRGSPFSVYNKYSSWFVLASRQWRAHRLSVRYERFRVTDEDVTPLDNNNETGHAWTLAYQYELWHNLFAGLEYMVVASGRPERALNGVRPAVSERQWKIALRYFF
ncbi:MAG TPA: hypothetical protein VFL45_06305 [Gammaproteobacteria bacterium]|nr:hypothetical protein [Gammaproteobacteria bacterium]